MKLNFFKRLSSKLYTIVPLIFLMGVTEECTKSVMQDFFSPPKNPFAQTNKGRGVVAYRIGERELVFYNDINNPRSSVQTWLLQKDNIYEFTIDVGGPEFSVNSEEMFKTGVKYSAGDTLAVAGKPVYCWRGCKVVSGWLEFRYFQDGIAAGNFEVVLVGVGEPHDTLKITDGTFDVKCSSIGAKK